MRRLRKSFPCLSNRPAGSALLQARPQFAGEGGGGRAIVRRRLLASDPKQDNWICYWTMAISRSSEMFLHRVPQYAELVLRQS